ncbi:ribosomal large subunit pseudouridine synthase B [Gottschalkia acidurici 9a]|uniref:Pseudouridine synthase n=1 Tax=Gottschalkia acidurici (strain ATCC 7906 / DSM 604 / BCRC 14475 / CIP 104303 / KCTC 5404 / NCIMB 10678 / 9a) TaxID=1128398 RepID=K0AXB2_GOTA9|nr:pseudouridine synthase [Gottschalkia acidurici]AFS78438.1 ribosomal large subunit pseudouridine synthase B [Gottschalkia acidurici 9a]
MRLQKFMAQCGVASRRKSEEIIQEGRVKVNGIIVKELGVSIDSLEDNITVDDKRIKPEGNKVYIALNKPTGYITTVSDQFGRKTVIDLISDIKERVYPIGRLDSDTSGLLLLTNDGDLAYKITHPKHEISKKYIAKVKGIPKEHKLKQFREGLKIDDYITSKAKVKIINEFEGNSILEIEIHEGKNRQVRKMCEKIGHEVIELERIAIGEINLKKIPLGKWRFLEKKEIEYLKRQ